MSATGAEDQEATQDDPVSPDETPAEEVAEAVVRKILSRQDILDSEDLATEPVPVPEWGGDVIVRALTGIERDAYEGEIFSLRGAGQGVEYNLQNIRAKLSARTMVDEDGVRLFSDSDVAALGLKSAAALDRVFTVAQRLSRLTAEDVKQLVDQMGNDQSVASGSA